MKRRSETQVGKEWKNRKLLPFPVLGSLEMATQNQNQNQNQKRKPDKTRQLWWLAIVASVAVYFVTAVFNESWVVVLHDKRVAGSKKHTFFNRDAKVAEMAAAVEGQEQDDKSMRFTAYDSSVKSSSGSRSLSKDSIINLDQGDPTMFESFWRKMGERGTVVIPGWQTMSYFSDATNVCWFLEPDFAQEIRHLHKLVGNAITEDRHIIVGTGSTQLFQAALYALSPSDAQEPMSVVSALPYYSSYPTVTDYLRSGLFQWAGDAYSFNGNSYIEIICSPNNPDGFIKQPVLNSKNGMMIHDLAYYWPQYTAMTDPADHDIMLFTVSKSTGHAGTRLGWALVKDRDVAKKMTKFIELNTIGVSKDSQVRAAKIMKAVSDGYELPTPDPWARLFDFGKRNLERRWERLREVAKMTNMFSLPVYPYDNCNFTGEWTTATPAFAWLKCEKHGVEDCENYLKSYKILIRSGKHFGMEDKYVRISMLDRDENFDLFIERLTSMK